MITKKDAYEYGWDRGWCAARGAVEEESSVMGKDELRDASFEVEEHSRQYADFCNSNFCQMPADYQRYDTVWASYDEGVTDGINSYLDGVECVG